MALCILCMGESGSGKTTSLRTLDPTSTYIIDSDRKGLSWRGWRKQYNKDNKNYFQTSDANMIGNILAAISSEDARKHIKTVVIDTLNMVMVDDEMKRSKERGFDKWQDLAQCIWELISYIHSLRDDLTVVCMAHSQTERDDTGYMFTRMKTSGKKLDKLVVESKFTNVILAKALDGEYVFEVHSDHSTAKTPLDCFNSKTVPNDMAMVINTLREYEEDM